MDTEIIELATYPTYSSRLAPNDIFLSPNNKNTLHGQRLLSSEGAVDASSQEGKKKCPDNWFGRMQKCVYYIG